MAQNITLLGASYSDVPSVELPKTGGGTAQFDDTTIASNAASASDITSGKLAFVNGELVTGTASGGGATLITKSITANGTYNASSDNADGYSSVTVNVSGGGGGGGNMSDPIRFFDYDGTLVASYSSVPASLPSVPSHTGLTNGTWNYTLQEVTTQFNAMGTCDVGANYDTASGKTEIDVTFDDEDFLSPYLGIAPNGTVTIDWGDNTTSTVTGTSYTYVKRTKHEYSSTGDYTISISGPFGLVCGNSSKGGLLLPINSGSSESQVYSNGIKAVRIGTNAVLGDYGLHYLNNLESVSIPSGITDFGTSVFQYDSNIKFIAVPSGTTTLSNSLLANCASLEAVSFPLSIETVNSSGCSNSLQKRVSIPSGIVGTFASVLYANKMLETVKVPSGITEIGLNAFYGCDRLETVNIPSGVTAIGNSAFYNCRKLQSIDLPSDVTTIGNSAFYGCRGLSSITVPSNVSSIGTQSFYYCAGVKGFHFESSTPPTLANTNVFGSIADGLKIYVPAASLTAYQTAENWSTFASYMVGE